MHPEVLSSKQLELLPILKFFSNDFGLVGGTAMDGFEVSDEEVKKTLTEISLK